MGQTGGRPIDFCAATRVKLGKRTSEQGRSVSLAYRFYIIGDENRILANELVTFVDDAAARRECEVLLARTSGAKAVEAWERARFVHRVE